VQSDCPGWVADGECMKNPGFMYKECPGSCGVCDGLKCADGNVTQCEIWAEAGECLANPLAVMKECPASCAPRALSYITYVTDVTYITDVTYARPRARPAQFHLPDGGHFHVARWAVLLTA